MLRIDLRSCVSPIAIRARFRYFLFHRRFSRARQVGDISCALAAPRSSAFPPRGTLRVSGPSQKDWPSFALAAELSFSVPPEKADLGLGSRHHLL